MTIVNFNILGISKLKWTGMSEFNSDDHYVYYCGQESLRRNGVALIVKIKIIIIIIIMSPNAVLWCNLKNEGITLVYYQGKPFKITVIQVYAPIIMLKKMNFNSSIKTYKIF